MHKIPIVFSKISLSHIHKYVLGTNLTTQKSTNKDIQK